MEAFFIGTSLWENWYVEAKDRLLYQGQDRVHFLPTILL